MKNQLLRCVFALCLMLCLVSVPWTCSARAEDNLQSGHWLYRMDENGAAEVTGYDDPSVVNLSIPSQLDGVWVTAIGDGAFAMTPALKELTIPPQVARISPNAFPAESKPVLRGWNGSRALLYANEYGMKAKTLSKLDFFPEIKDLSEIPDGLWRDKGGELRIDAPYASLIEQGDKLFLPAHGGWTQGMPVLVSSLRHEGTTAVVSYTALTLPQTLRSYHADNVALEMDESGIILGEGVFYVPSLYSNISGTMGNEKTFGFEKSGNGITVSGSATLSISATASIDYEWLNINEVTLSLNQTGSIHAEATYDGEKAEEEGLKPALTRSFLLFRVPLVSQGFLGAWADVYVKFNLTGEVSFDAKIGSTQQMTIRGGAVVSKSCTTDSPEATLAASASLHAGIAPDFVLRLGFPGKVSAYIDIASLNLYLGLIGTVSYTTDAPLCYNLEAGIEASADATYGPVAMLNDEHFSGESKTVHLGGGTLSLWQKHWEGSESRWQQICTYADLCTVSIFTGTGESVEPISVKKGELIGAPKAPEREGYTFTFWYADEYQNRKFDFTQPIMEDITLYAGWKAGEPTPTPSPEPTPTPELALTPEPSATPESATPTPIPEIYPLSDIPNAVDSLALCEVTEFDTWIDVNIPDSISSITICNTYRGKRLVYSNGLGLKAVAIAGDVPMNSAVFSYMHIKNIETVYLSNGITSIGDGAFSSLSFDSLTHVIFPSSLQSIGDQAFHGHDSLESVVIPEGVTSIGSYAFGECYNLKEVILPGTLQTIGKSAFCDSSIDRLVISEGVTDIDNYAFYFTANIGEISLPSTLKSIGEFAFTGCLGLERIEIPNSVTSIGAYAFQFCYDLKEAVLPSSLESMGDHVFTGCQLEHIVLPEGLRVIGEHAFYQSNIRSVTLPSTLETLSSGSFGYNYLLEEITTYAKTTKIQAPFYDCENLKLLRAYEDSDIAKYFRQNHPNVKIVPPDTEGYLVRFETQRGTQPEDMFVPAGNLIPEPEKPVWESRVFEGWYKNWLRTEPWDFAVDRMPDHSITLYAKWSYTVTGTVINRGHKSYLASLVDPEENLVIPGIVGEATIVGLMPNLVPPGVKTVHLSSIIEDVRPGTFRRASDLAAITVDENNPNYYAVDGVLYARDGSLVCYPAARAGSAFSVPSSVLSLAEHAFSGCRALEELSLPDTLTALSPAAVNECSALRRVTFAADPLAIGESCFLGCPNLRVFGPEDAVTLKTYATGNAVSFNEYRLIYYSDGRLLAETRVAVGDPINPIGGPTQDERVLLGWSDDPQALTVTDFDQYLMPAHDLTLYAVWGYAFSWQDDGSGGVRLLRYNGAETTVRVPETVEGKPVAAIADDAFSGLSSPTLLGNRGSVTEAYAAAKGYAFQPLSYTLRFESNGGTQLPPQTLCATDTVEIPSCIRTGYTLNGWYLDSDLTRPWNQTVMPAGDLTLYAGWTQSSWPPDIPFSYRTTAEGIFITGYTGSGSYISVPDQINETPVVGIDEGAFAGCPSVTNVNLPETVQSIGARAFQGMPSLTSAWLPDGLSVIPEGAFQGCAFLKSVSLPDNLERIESAAFSGCIRLKSVTLNATLSSIAPDAFSGCQALRSFNLWQDNPTFSTESGALFSEQGSRLLLYPMGSPYASYTVPDGVTVIDEGVCFPTQITTLFIPASVTSLSVSSFDSCNSKLVVNVSAGSAAEAFFKANLPHIHLGYDQPSVEDGLVIRLPDGPISIGVPAQLTCQLDGVQLEPEAVIWAVEPPELGEITESGVLTLRHSGWPTITATLREDTSIQGTIDDMLFFSDHSLILPAALKTVGEEAFRGSRALEDVVIPDGTERIESLAFADCPWLFSVFIPSSVTYIADDAFSNSPNVCLFIPEGSYAQTYAERMRLSYWLTSD